MASLAAGTPFAAGAGFSVALLGCAAGAFSFFPPHDAALLEHAPVLGQAALGLAASVAFLLSVLGAVMVKIIIDFLENRTALEVLRKL